MAGLPRWYIIATLLARAHKLAALTPHDCAVLRERPPTQTAPLALGGIHMDGVEWIMPRLEENTSIRTLGLGANYLDRKRVVRELRECLKRNHAEANSVAFEVRI